MKLTILFSTIDGLGHLNASIGIGEVLCDRGHTVVFCIPYRWKGRVAPLGFVEELYQISESDTKANGDGESKWGEIILQKSAEIALDSIHHHKNFYLPMYEEMFSQVKYADTRFREIMSRVKPDVVVVDTCYQTPALIDQGVPWILSTSFNPLGISTENSPPAWGGFPAESDRKLWELYEAEFQSVHKEFLKEYNAWMENHGSTPYDYKFPILQKYSPWANMYVFPQELDYTDLRPIPPNWHQFDSFMKRDQDPTPFEIPAKLKSGPGKLIYFSMGTIGCINIPLVQKLLGFLAKSPNRFIISKGPMGGDLVLGDNMWGEAILPQTKVIPQVDLVITHGGNNTLTESFYYGKRIIVLPLLWDQLDNGQRMRETGLGLCFHPYHVIQQELNDGIETLLANDTLEQRMRAIGERIQASHSKERAADLVERVGSNPKNLIHS